MCIYHYGLPQDDKTGIVTPRKTVTSWNELIRATRLVYKQGYKQPGCQSYRTTPRTWMEASSPAKKGEAPYNDAQDQ